MSLFRRTILVLVALACFVSPGLAEDKPRVPTIDDLLNIDSLGGARISPNGKWVAYLVTHTNFKQDAFVTHLWIVEPASGRKFQLTRGDKSTGDPIWSPDSAWLAFTSSRAGDKNQIFAIAPDGPDGNPRWSPDGKQIAFETVMGNPGFFHCNRRLAVVPADGGTPRPLTDEFDEHAFLIDWKPDGIYFAGLQKTTSHLFRIQPDNPKVTRLTSPDDLQAFGFSLTHDGHQVAFTATSPSKLGEVFVSDVDGFAPRQLTDMTAQTKSLILGKSEVISWKSQDGTAIEGVLTKPADFDSAKKRPLLCIIHGGPTGIDMPTLLASRYYPADIWAGRGALILRVNYRGSAGYGEKFRQLNVGNLGVGDAWDVLSGVDHLIKLGWVEPAKVACMGWSQGGYISAFLTASSDRFAAISVGAGISNWATYYYNTDITPFTIQYLGKDPIADPAIYQKTSPMSYIQKAKTPTLIQHGENDKRVPIANAYELRQGLENRAAKVEMIVYKGYGHGITKPRSQRAVMQHNLAWFNHYLWGDPLPDFANPEVPKAEKPGE